ncbi:hypothetical protein BsWGS_16555 [Bradybaena similaris]
MMLTATVGSSTTAPRQSRLKKPRPLRSLSMQEGSVSQDDGQAGDVQERKLSLGSLEVDMSAPYAGNQGSSVCKEIAILSSRLLSFNDSPHKNRSLSLQNSSSSDCSFQHHNVSRHPDCSFQHHNVSRHPDCSSPLLTAESADKHSHPSLRTEPPAPLDFQHSNLQPKNTNDNSNRGAFHMTLDDYVCQAKCDPNDEGYETIGIDGSPAGRTRFEFSTPITAGTQSSGAKNQETSQSFQYEPAWVATKATLLTGAGEELKLVGKNFKTLLHASRILLKELDAKLVRIESVSDDDDEEETCKDEVLSFAEEVASQVAAPASDSCVAGCFPQQKEWNKHWNYSKDELLLLSRSVLSHQPPSMWHVIANTHTDCCIPATKVINYFEPSMFHVPDGSVVKNKCCL